MKISKRLNIFICVCIVALTMLLGYFLYFYKDIQHLSVPKDMKASEVDSYVISKLTDIHEINFVKGFYLNNNHTADEVDKMREILKKTGFYFNMISIDRDIDTDIKNILNGYLGQVFKFKVYGTYSITLIPFAFYLLLKRKKISVSTKGIILLCVVSVLLLVKFRYNYRYQFTLLPLQTLFSALFVNTYISSLKKLHRYLIVITLLFLGIINSCLYLYMYYTDSRGGVYGITKSNKKVSSFINDDPRFIEKKFLVNNLPLFFYETTNFGVYYWSYPDMYYSSTKREHLMLNKSNEDVYKFLKKDMDISYVITALSYEKYNNRFTAFLNEYGTIVYKGSQYLIYSLD